MFLIDLDAVDWTKAPVEFLGYANVDAVREWLRKQPVVTAYVLTQSQHPLIKTKAIEAAMDLNRFVMDIAQVLAYQNAEKGGST